MKRRTRVFIGVIGCFLLSIFGISRLLMGDPGTVNFFIPILLGTGGLIGLIGGLVELNRIRGREE